MRLGKHLVVGPAGSGKTAFVLDQLREALRANQPAVRLLVPTSTLAQHLQNEIAREGFVFRPGLIQTLSSFIEAYAADFPQVPDAVLYLLVEEAVRRVNRPEFRRVSQTPGFCASLARTISEFSSAGCGSARLAARRPEAPLAAAFLTVYEEVDRMLDGRGLLLRAQRLEYAAARIHAGGLGGIRTIWLDGFHALPDPELAVIGGLAQHAEVTVTLADTDASADSGERLRAMGFSEERLMRKRGAPATVLVRAPGIEREIEEIARRICEQAAAGRPFREMGIIVRSAETYVPLLRATLERFRIPARFYFEEELNQSPVIRFLTGAVDAMLGGWDHGETLAVLRLAPRFADSRTMDQFDFSVREQIPERGLSGLQALAGAPEGPLSRLLDSLAALEEWRSFELTPADWAARFQTLRNIYRPAPPSEPATHESAPLWRTQAAALDRFDEAVNEAAQALDSARRLHLAEYWHAVRAVLRLKPIRLTDGRRNVVHVLSAHEARQWALPVVFVCGMVEKQFPQFHPQDPFFPDSARARLNAAGIRVRTATEFEREERALFDSALARASVLVTLSYPEFNERGDRNLPSLFLEDLGLPAENARAVRPQPRFWLSPAPGPALHAPALLADLLEKTAKVTPSGLETYLQCPFQYFAGRLLRLKTTPPRPEDRLDYQEQGRIVHQVLAEWYASAEPLASVFQRVFDACCEERPIPAGYHTERLRNALLEDLERFAADPAWPRQQFSSQAEQAFVFPLNESIQVAGRIDRIDTAGDGRAYVIDYKYSALQRVKERKNGDGLQGPLYVMAAERAFGVRPAGMFFVGLKGGVEYVGWSENGPLSADPMPADWPAATAARVARLVEEIRDGRIEPVPKNPASCRFCDIRDVCRIDVRQRAAAAEDA